MEYRPIYTKEAMDEALAEITALRSRITELEQALKALVHYEPWMDNHPDENPVSTFKGHTFGDLRRAARALKPVNNMEV